MLRCEAQTSNINQTVFIQEMRYFKKKMDGHFNVNLMLVRIISVYLAKVRKVRACVSGVKLDKFSRRRMPDRVTSSTSSFLQFAPVK